MISWLAVTRNPGWWPVDLPAAELGQGDHPLAGEGLGEPVRVAGGLHEVRVVEQPVDGGGGECLGMMVSSPDGWMLLVTATERRS